MKKIIRLARVELSSMFYSPIAWLLLIIFLVQCSLSFMDNIQAFRMAQELARLYPRPPRSATFAILAAPRTGLFPAIVSKLYLYLPLLTMGLISREVSSGSIRLLYSSPIKVSQIVFGKFLAVMVYNTLLTAVLCCFAVVVCWAIPHPDTGLMLSGLLAIFLLLATYAAIGLFMSCLTAYQVVAALSTLAVFAFLQYIGQVWQGIDLVRDITYFLSLGSRTADMFGGLLISRDVLYFVIITALFLGLAILRLQADQESRPVWGKAARYGGLAAAGIGLACLTSLPAVTCYIDTTARQVNTLTPATQALLKATGNEPLELTAYVNLLDTRYSLGEPAARHEYLRFWERYSRFKPIHFNFYYYYDTTANNVRMLNRTFKGQPLAQVARQYARTNHVALSLFKSPLQARREEPGLEHEGGRMVLTLAYKGRKTFLRIYDDQERWPSEVEFSAALQRLMQPSAVPVIGFLDGYLQRSCDNQGERSYAMIATQQSSRTSLVNNGFDVVHIADGAEIPSGLAALVIADPKMSFTQPTLEKLLRYIAGGGSLLITGEPGKQEVLYPLLHPLGITMKAGILVTSQQNEAPDQVAASVSKAAGQMSQGITQLYNNRQPVWLSGATALTYQQDSAHAFACDPLLAAAGEGVWLKKAHLVNDSSQVMFNEKEGDEKGVFITALALHRPWQQRQQRILVTGDADFMSNRILQQHQQANLPFSLGLFKWLGGGAFPVEQSRPGPIDTKVSATENQLSGLGIWAVWILPALLLAAGAILLLRRKRK